MFLMMKVLVVMVMVVVRVIQIDIDVLLTCVQDLCGEGRDDY